MKEPKPGITIIIIPSKFIETFHFVTDDFCT